MYIKPKLGLVIPDPERRDILPAEGREVASFVKGGLNVPASAHWQRRKNDGDVIEAEAPKVESATGEPRTEIQPNADGTATFTGEHPAEPAHEGA